MRSTKRRASNHRIVAFSGKRNRSKPSRDDVELVAQRRDAPRIAISSQPSGKSQSRTSASCVMGSRRRAARPSARGRPRSSTSHERGSSCQRTPSRSKRRDAYPPSRAACSSACRRTAAGRARADQDVAAVLAGPSTASCVVERLRSLRRGSRRRSARAVGADQKHRRRARSSASPQRVRHARAEVAFALARAASRRSGAIHAQAPGASCRACTTARSATTTPRAPRLDARSPSVWSTSVAVDARRALGPRRRRGGS